MLLCGWLPPTGDGAECHRDEARRRRVGGGAGARREDVRAGRRVVAGASRPLTTCVWSAVSAIVRVCACSRRAARAWSRRPVDRHATAQVGQGEVDPAVAAVGRAEQREERLVLVDRQQLPLHAAQPFGAKRKLISRISPRNGSAMTCSLVLRGRRGSARGREAVELGVEDASEVRRPAVREGWDRR